VEIKQQSPYSSEIHNKHLRLTIAYLSAVLEYFEQQEIDTLELTLGLYDDNEGEEWKVLIED